MYIESFVDTNSRNSLITFNGQIISRVPRNIIEIEIL